MCGGTAVDRSDLLPSLTALPLGGAVAHSHLSAERVEIRVADWAEPCLRPLRVAGTVPSAPAIGRSRFEASCEGVVSGYRPVSHRDLPASGYAEFLP